MTVEELRWHPETGAPTRAEREAQSQMILVETLRVAVPLWMAHWWRWPPAIREARGRYCGQLVGTHGDQIQWHSKSRKARVMQEATDECLASLEAAPGFRPAQKLLLELSNSPEPAAPPVKK